MTDGPGALPEDLAPAPWSELVSPEVLPKLLVVLLGVWINAADALVTSTIMPSVTADIGGYAAFSWAVAGFLIGAVVAGASAGRLAERFGMGPASAAAGVIFAAGCAASALAPSMELFLTGRLIQGIGSGWFSGFAMVAIAQIFPRRHMGRVFAIVSTVWGIATLLGPLIGGLLAQFGNWRAVFWTFAAQALVFAMVAPRYFGGTRARSLGGAVPALQLVLIACSIAMIALANSAGSRTGSVAMIAAGLVLLVAALAIDRKARTHLLPRSAADPRTVIGAGYAAVFALTAAGMPFTIYVPPILQQSLALTPVQAGYVVASSSIAWTLATLATSNIQLGRETGGIRLGAALVALGVLLQAFAVPSLSLPLIVVSGAVMGLGFGAASPLVNRRAISHLAPDEEAIGSAALMTVRQIGGAVGAALAGTVANAAGFGEGLTDASALATARSIFWAALALALLGAIAALAMARQQQS